MFNTRRYSYIGIFPSASRHENRLYHHPYGCTALPLSIAYSVLPLQDSRWTFLSNRGFAADCLIKSSQQFTVFSHINSFIWGLTFKPTIFSLNLPVFASYTSLKRYFTNYSADYIFILYSITKYKMPPVSESLPTLLSYSLWYFSIVTFSIVVEPYSCESWLLIVSERCPSN